MFYRGDLNISNFSGTGRKKLSKAKIDSYVSKVKTETPYVGSVLAFIVKRTALFLRNVFLFNLLNVINQSWCKYFQPNPKVILNYC